MKKNTQDSKAGPRSRQQVTVTEELFIKLWAKVKKKRLILDEDLWKWFDGSKIPLIQRNFSSVVKRFTKTATPGEAVMQFKGSFTYTWLEAMRMMIDAIMAGEVDQKGKHVVVIFQTRKVPYRISAYRDTDNELRVGVNEFALCKGIPLNAGNGICIANT